MFTKLVWTAFLFGALFAESGYAAPSLHVVPQGILNGNRQWLVSVEPDAALFAFFDPPGKVGATVNTELGFTVGTGSLVSAVKNALDWPMNNSALNPFTNTTTTGVSISGNHVFSSLGSVFFTTFFPYKQLLTITTAGSGKTTLTWSGAYQGKGRLAENGFNFDSFSGSITVPEPPSLLMAVMGGIATIAWHRRRLASIPNPPSVQPGNHS